jgi:hypothetical protein
VSATRLVTPLHRFGSLVAALVLVSLFAASAAHAQIWVESGDAGDLVPTAQVTVGPGALIQIQGSLASATDVDVYCVRVVTQTPQSVALIGLNCTVVQGPNVWLFDAAGNGLASNGTCSGGAKQIPALTSLPPGNYYVAVSYYDYDPQSAGGAIWLPLPPSTRAPDGPGAGGTLTGWAGTPNVQPLNPYQVYFNPDYFAFCEAATPVSRPTWGALKLYYGR